MQVRPVSQFANAAGDACETALLTHEDQGFKRARKTTMVNNFKDGQEHEAMMQKCRQLISTGKRIEAIREYRAATGYGLATAQRALGLR